MWIRSQNRHVLQKVDNIWADTGAANLIKSTDDTNGINHIWGAYATEKRCLKVLDEIQMAIIGGKKAFLMPEE